MYPPLEFTKVKPGRRRSRANEAEIESPGNTIPAVADA